MSAKRITAALGIVVLATAIFASAAGAEPKNQWPFTRPFDNRILAQAVDLGASLPMPIGEPKNEAPFTTRFSADPGMAAALRTISRYYAGDRNSPLAAPEPRSSGALGTGLVLVLVLGAAGLGGVALLARHGGFMKVS
jgi:hypothetical protein